MNYDTRILVDHLLFGCILFVINAQNLKLWYLNFWVGKNKQKYAYLFATKIQVPIKKKKLTILFVQCHLAKYFTTLYL